MLKAANMFKEKWTTQTSSFGSGNKKALIVGISYERTGKNTLGATHSDSRRIEFEIKNNFGFDDRNVRVLRDDPKMDTQQPTRANILLGLRWLVAQAESGDSLFFYYAGHGTQKKDTGGDERDNMDEALVPVDFQDAGIISDDLINAELVKNVPQGVICHCIIDACHSGTMTDLPFEARVTKGNNPDWVIDRSNKRAKRGLLPPRTRYKKLDVILKGGDQDLTVPHMVPLRYTANATISVYTEPKKSSVSDTLLRGQSLLVEEIRTVSGTYDVKWSDGRREQKVQTTRFTAVGTMEQGTKVTAKRSGREGTIERANGQTWYRIIHPADGWIIQEKLGNGSFNFEVKYQVGGRVQVFSITEKRWFNDATIEQIQHGNILVRYNRKKKKIWIPPHTMERIKPVYTAVDRVGQTPPQRLNEIGTDVEGLYSGQFYPGTIAIVNEHGIYVKFKSERTFNRLPQGKWFWKDLAKRQVKIASSDDQSQGQRQRDAQRLKKQRGVVITLSGCTDTQLSKEIQLIDRAVDGTTTKKGFGVMTNAFCEAVQKRQHGSYKTLLEFMRQKLNEDQTITGEKRQPQTPQLTCNVRFDLSSQFLMRPLGERKDRKLPDMWDKKTGAT